MDMRIDRIGIVGTGLIGASWAAFYAAKGFHVSMYDAIEDSLSAGYEKTQRFLSFLAEHDMLSADDHARSAAAVTVTDDLPACVRDVQLVQESVIERYDVKKDIFAQIDAAAPTGAIVASSSSGLLITDLQSVMRNPQRALIAHPFNPPHLIPLVELVPGEQTASEVVERTKAFFCDLGKVPVILNVEVPGHIANRLQAAVWREAIDLVLKGVASVADVDKALSAGPGLRWSLLGSHTIFHLGGGSGGIKHFIDHVGASWDKLWTDMAAWTALPPETTDALTAGIEEATAGKSLDEIAVWRDEKIIELLKTIYETRKRKGHRLEGKKGDGLE